MRNKLMTFFVAVATALSSVAMYYAYNDNVGHSYYKTRSFHIKRHSTNLTTVQVDTFKTGGGGVAADRFWQITGTGMDTSRAYLSWPYMTIRYAFEDTSATDSIGYELKVYAGSRGEWATGNYSDPPAFGSSYSAPNWILVDSLTISSATGQWILTSSTFPNSPWLYFTLEGTADNVTLTNSVGTIIMDTFTEIPR